MSIKSFILYLILLICDTFMFHMVAVKSFPVSPKVRKVKLKRFWFLFNENAGESYRTHEVSLSVFYSNYHRIRLDRVFSLCNMGIKWITNPSAGRRRAPRSFLWLIDNNGNTVVEYYYDAWGNHKVVDANGDEITDLDNIGNLNPFRYRGYYYDTETGLYFLQTRYYDPEVGRFLNRDSVQYADPETINGLNLYAYCLNNPIEYTDPYGTTEWWEWLLGAAIIVAAVGLSIATAGLASSFSAALGSGFAASMAGGAIASGASGAISAFGISVGSQIIFNGADNIKWNQVYNDTLNGLASGIAAGAIFGAIRYLFPIDKIASSLSGLDRAQDYYNRAEFIFRSTPILFNGGVMATERIVARLNFEIARYSLGLI